jgi:methylthioribulose-1-phosphate dehydratase
MVGTAGNLSARNEGGSFWITASGQPKGRLEPGSFLRMTPEGEPIETTGGLRGKPSAETSIHVETYRRYPEARACYHVHSIEANLVSRLPTEDGWVALPGLEMLKGLGVWDPEPNVGIEILPNHPHVPDIAEDMKTRFDARPPSVPGFLIRDHGLTVWAADQMAALHYVELFDYLFRFMLRARELRLD